MTLQHGSVLIRRPEVNDSDALYEIKNDPAVMSHLGGFHVGLSSADIKKWIEFHNSRTDEVVWIIADAESNQCIGHAGLYKIDYRIRSAEFAILVSKDRWGDGIGREVSERVISFGFLELNLSRISLTVLEGNARARALYEKIGFMKEGVFRRAQYKGGRYHHLVCYSILREEFDADAP